MSKTEPSYYKQNGKDLFGRFEDGLMPADEIRGFYKGNIFKYITRYQNKNGVEDLQKAKVYLEQLIKFERPSDQTGDAILPQADTEKLVRTWQKAVADEKGEH